MTTKVNTPNLNATFLGSLVKVNDTQTVNNKTFNSPTLVTPALGTPASGDFSTGVFTWPLFYQDIKANAAFVAANSAGVYANASFIAANSAGTYANAAFAFANTGDQKAVSSGVYANAAYTQANTATTDAATADLRAVISGVFANGAYLAANTADQRAVTSGSYANSAYTLANTKYSSSGGAISGDVTITGNLTITGATTTVSANNLSIQDNMIYLNANNTTINPDLGIAGNYNDGTYHHTGVFRDATDGTWKFFYNYDPEPDASPYIDTAHATFRIANLTANLITDVAVIRGYDPINHTNSAFTQANTANTNAASASSYANSGYTQANTANTNAASASSYANSGYTQANTANTNAASASSYANSAFDVANAAVTTTGTQTLTNKTLTSPVINTPTGIVKGDVGLGNVDNTSDATKNAATATLTNKTLTSPVINTPTGIVKGDVGLGNVDNTSDATKNAATATLTNKSLSDNTTYFIDENDATKRMQLQLSAIGTGATRILTVPNFNGTIATIAGTETLTNKTLTLPVLSFPSISSPIEPVTVNNSSPSATLNYYVNANTVVYHTTSATNDFTWNVGYDGTTTLNTWLANGRALTIVLLITNAGTAYYPNAFSIDGTSVTPKYVGGNAITAGNANSIDSYTMTIIKTASATYTVLLSQTKLA